MNKKNIKRNILKKTKMGVAVSQIVLMTSLNILSGFAGVPQVTVDETVYTNLDYYGARKDLSIVKGVSLNGYTDFSDYGDYSNVINMTSDNAPKLDANQVSFSSLDSSKKFYYEVTPKSNDLELPDGTYAGSVGRRTRGYGKKQTGQCAWILQYQQLCIVR